MMFFNDIPANPKTQARADVSFGCEERLEQLRSSLRRDARARVRDRQPDTLFVTAIPTSSSRDANPNLSHRTNRIDAVAQEIRDKLANLTRHRIDLRVLPDFGMNPYCLVSCFVRKNRDKGIQCRSQGHATCALSFPVEPERLLCQVRNAL